MGKVRYELGEISYHSQESLQLLFVLRALHFHDCLDLLGIWHESFAAECVANVTDFVQTSLALISIEFKILLFGSFQHLP